MYTSRVTIFVGQFGSGKTEIAINGAFDLAGRGDRVALVDLDVVKPYFRSRSARELLAVRGVQVVAPTGENVFADLPIIVPQVRGLLHDPGVRLIVDAGGDPTGARVLGSLADAIPEGETETLVVLNFRRPFSDGADDAVVMIRAIEAAARRRIDGIVSNTHLLEETSPAIVIEGFRSASDVASRLGLAVVAVAIDERTAGALPSGAIEAPLLVLHRVVMPPFAIDRPTRRSGPVFLLN
jgi:hypothetical protein